MKTNIHTIAPDRITLDVVSMPLHELPPYFADVSAVVFLDRGHIKRVVIKNFDLGLGSDIVCHHCEPQDGWCVTDEIRETIRVLPEVTAVIAKLRAETC